MIRIPLTALATLPLLALPALAAGPSMDQWRIVEGKTMRQIVDDGYEIKSALIDDTTFYYDHVKYWIYTLQKGTDVLECSERIQYMTVGETLSVERSDLGCYTLVPPYAVQEELGGLHAPDEVPLGDGPFAPGPGVPRA
jgi:hypothetical protein